MATLPQVFKPSSQPPATAMVRARSRLSEITGVAIKSTLDEVRLTQSGVTVKVFECIKELGASASELDWIIKPRTLTHRRTKQEPLTQAESGRWLRAAKAQALAVEVFGDKGKAVAWLHKSRKRFGGQNAMNLIQTESGAQLVQDTLNQLDSGYFA